MAGPKPSKGGTKRKRQRDDPVAKSPKSKGSVAKRGPNPGGKKTESGPRGDGGGVGRGEGSDWIAALAKKAATAGAPPSSSSSAQSGTARVPSKAERIERRNAKRRRREDRNREAADRAGRAKLAAVDDLRSDGQREGRMGIGGNCARASAVKGLRMIAEEVEDALKDVAARGGGGDGEGTKWVQPYVDPASSIRGKATSGQRKMTKDALQPRRRDYGGLGLARPSLYLDLHDASFVPKFEQEFAEHIPGFFGKQRTKAMKRQLDGKMLWRQLAEKKGIDMATLGKGKIKQNSKFGGKRLSEMTPDERVEAMMKAGII